MTTITNAEKLRQYENVFLIIERILAFALSINFVSEVKNVSPNFKRIA